MAEADRPSESTPLAADDMIGSLATRVRELSLRVAELEGQLEAARKRVAVYEDFDTQVQDSLTAALRAANQIRERAKVSAEAIAQEARAQRPADRRELEAVRIERDALRRAIEAATTSTPSRSASASAPAAVFQMSEMRTAATEALRGVFKELVAEIRSLPVESAPPAAAQPAAASPRPAAVEPAAASPRPANSPSAPAQPTVAEMPAAQLPVSATPPPAPYVAPAPTPTPYVAPAPRPVVVPQPQAQPSALVEDVDVAPAAAAPAPAPAPTPAPAATAPQAVPAQAREEWVTPTEPIGEVQVVLSPISSFPRLVELERRLQGMPAVRTVYARDFRNGVATLAIGLRNPMTVEEFAAAVTRLEYPRLKVVSTTGYVLELRIDSEASSIA